MRFTPYFVFAFFAMLIIAGFVVDAGGKTQTTQQALTVAQSAARAGTNAATGGSVNGDAFDLSGQMAATAAQNYLAAAGFTGTATVVGPTITVTVDTTYQPRILGIIGLPDVPVTATGSAQLIGD